MLDDTLDEADVGRCDADAICASERAASVKPALPEFSASAQVDAVFASLHFRSGACLSVFLANSAISDQLPLQSA